MYQITESENQIMISQIMDFHLDHIFDCGQCFRWTKQKDGSYTGIAYGKVTNISFIPNEESQYCGTIILKGSTVSDFEQIWKSYLDLDRNYSKIKEMFRKKDNTMAKAITYGEGIRILNQEEWETLISFIISQNNNIPRIKKCIESLCTSFGEKISAFNGREFYSFPSPETLSKLTVEDLDLCKLGYRAKYMIETAKLVNSDSLKLLGKMRQASKEEAREYLLSLCGVGPKVASCIMLFSMGKFDSFPMDVWVKRVMNQLYGIKEDDTAKMQDFADKNFGEFGGIAQQYLFYYIRQVSKQ